MPLPVFWTRLFPFGRRAELRAARYLRSLGFRVVASGYRVREGEVDLIAWEGDILVFVEVKARTSAEPPENAVGLTKQRRVLRAARAYLSRHRLHDVTCRFDVVAVNEVPGKAVEYRLLRDVFRASA